MTDEKMEKKLTSITENQPEKTKENDVDKLPLEDRLFTPPTPAQATFARKPTEKELKRKTLIIEMIEKGWWILAMVIVLILLWLNRFNFTSFFDFLLEPETPTPVPATEKPTALKSQVVAATIMGEVRKLDEDLGFLNENFFTEVNYYSAGQWTTGEYANGERIVVVAKKGERVRSFVFVKMPDGEVFFDGGKPNTVTWLQNLQGFYLLNEIKAQAKNIKFVSQVTSDHPDFLPVSEKMILYKERLLTDSGPYENESSGMTSLPLPLNANEYKNLSSLAADNYTTLKIYEKIYNLSELQSQVTNNWTDEDLKIMDTYLRGGTKFVVTDATGLAYIYELVYKDKYEAYKKETLETELFSLNLYQEELAKYTATEQFELFQKDLANGINAEWPVGLPKTPPVGQNLPGFDYKTTAFEDVTLFFNSYIPALISTCSDILDAKVLQNLTMAELEAVGRIFVPQATVYKLKDQNHPLNQLAFDLKFRGTGLTDDEIVAANESLILSMKNYTRQELNDIAKGKKKIELPTVSEYASKVPLLFVVDPWQRVLMLEEADVASQPDCVQKMAVKKTE